MTHRIEQSSRDGFSTWILASSDEVEAEFAPNAGMVGCSLRHRGEELLGQCQGLRSYARTGAPMGIPLLHPWANRLARYGYEIDGVRVDIPRDAANVQDDGRDLPIHGLLAGCSQWRILESAASADSARLAVELDLAALPDVMRLFPFPHRLSLQLTLCGRELRIDTTLLATGERPVPVALGFHPYFQLPNLPRSEWEVRMPVRTRALLDARCLPTGASEPAAFRGGLLGSRVLDDLFVALDPDPVFMLSGGGRRIEVAYGPAFPVAVVYAPADNDVVCFEPMTLPTNPFEGHALHGFTPRRIAPGDRFEAGFSIRIEET